MAARAKEFKVPLPLALKIDKFVEIYIDGSYGWKPGTLNAYYNDTSDVDIFGR